MTTDPRLASYLRVRSTAIDLPHAGVDTITRRARRHQRRRRAAACGGVATALLLGGTAIALGAGGDDPTTSTTDRAASVVGSPLEWTTTEVQDGLGLAGPVVSDGGAVYALSTEAGSDTWGSRRLYRSTDGDSWTGVDLPADLHAAGVAGSEGSLYAVGTSAAGGDLQIATSTDGGAGWSGSDVPLDLEALAEGFPGTARIADAEVAVADGTTVVVASVRGLVDPAEVLPADADPDAWYQTSDGLTRIQDDPCAASAEEGARSGATTTVPPTTSAPATAPAADPEGVDGATAGEDCTPTREVVTWEEMGVGEAGIALAEGQTHVFVATDGGPLEPSQVIPGTTSLDPMTASLLAADDGFWYVRQSYGDQQPGEGAATTAWHSVDGATWTEVPVAGGEGLVASGVLDGRPAVVTIGNQQEWSVHVHVVAADGSVATTDLNELLGIEPGSGMMAVDVGPLGLAVVFQDEAGVRTVAHSPDGLALSAVEVPAPADGTRETVAGVTVTADAVKVRLNVRPAGSDGTTPATSQRLFVGTPPG
ncbi:hypothetical protein HC251_03830 [Iamia sp. SCSIO 61187]|uniref:hypothetical protein n=1 Tax=Iamia sp. SCSIO 61187 TaxID=2722752 RepID=UPI001C62A8AB|nr:hypothetical protein [Iamia sp. SCSIO 61187]QYG91653.1 hypothetical protein HC251_03830 [Iamia sp. SCSIO 61187]